MTTRSVALEVARWLVGGPIWPQFRPPDLPAAYQPLQQILDDALVDPSFAHLGVVLLNFGPVDAVYWPPACAYKRHTDRFSIGSAGKLAIIYAAFQLKADVQAVLDQVAAKISPAAPTLADLQKPLADYWLSIPVLKDWLQEKRFKLPAPNLKALFDEPEQSVDSNTNKPRWTISFAGISTCGYAKDWATVPVRKQMIDTLCTVHKHEKIVSPLLAAQKTDPSQKPKYLDELKKWQDRIIPLSFAERLWLTARWSDNLAATLTAIDIARPVPDLSNANDALTLAYIQAVLKHSTLGDVDKGLWINAAYQEPFQPPPPPPLKMWKNPWHYSDAQSLARLLIALSDVSNPASSEIVDLLRHLDPIEDFVGGVQYTDLEDPARGQQSINWADSYTLRGMFSRSVTFCASKIGIDGNIATDFALIDCQVGSVSHVYRFGIVVVNRTDVPSNISSFGNTLFAKLRSPANERALAKPS